MTIKCSILGSGSKGNAVYVEIDGKCFLLDCGLNYKTLKKRLADINRDPSCLSAVFVSHSHQDHIAGIKILVKSHPGVKIFTEGDEKNVTSFALDHDTQCVGYRVEDNDGNVLVYSTDTGSIPCDSLEYYLDADVIIQEFNYDTGALVAGPYPDELKLRVMATHTENRQARNLLELVASGKLKHVVAFHLSGQNNYVDLVKYEAKRGLSGYPDVKVHVAEQNRVLPVTTLI